LWSGKDEEKFKEKKWLQRFYSQGTRAGSDSRILQTMLESWGEKPTLNGYEVLFEAYEEGGLLCPSRSTMR